MCVIVDTNAVGELWDRGNSPAGQRFRRWVEGPGGGLVVGGQIKQELESSSAARWLQELDRTDFTSHRRAQLRKHHCMP